MSTKPEITVSSTQVKRHKKKPAVEISLALAKRMLREKSVKVQKGKAYILYSCGHISDADEDPNMRPHFSERNRAVRCCPECLEKSIKKEMLTKYKKCGCGAEHVGKRVQPSDCCASCPPVRKLSEKYRPKHTHKRNEEQADPTRYDCAKRDECLKTYFDYDALPCKGCKKYVSYSIVSDPKI